MIHWNTAREPGMVICCPACGTTLPSAAIGAESWVPCATCTRPLHADLFPAAFHRPQSSLAVTADADDATCFFHAGKRAVVPCDHCGRFLCALCDLEILGAHVCPTCAARPASERAAQSVRESTLWDSAALGLALYPLLIFYFTIITAPIALFLTIRHWRTPTGLVPRSRFRFVLAGFLAAAQIIGWILLFAFLFRSVGATPAPTSG